MCASVCAVRRTCTTRMYYFHVVLLGHMWWGKCVGGEGKCVGGEGKCVGGEGKWVCGEGKWVGGEVKWAGGEGKSVCG